jgi:hypothetical protein
MVIKIPPGSSFLNTPRIRQILERNKKKANPSPAAAAQLATSAVTDAAFTDDVKRPTPAEKWGTLKLKG